MKATLDISGGGHLPTIKPFSTTQDDFTTNDSPIPQEHDIMLTSYHGVEYPKENDTAVQFLDGRHQLLDEEEEKDGREKQKDNIIDPNTVCVVSCVGGKWRDLCIKGEYVNMAECTHLHKIARASEFSEQTRLCTVLLVHPLK